MAKTISAILITLSLVPLIFWTLTPNIFSTPKELAIAAASVVLLLVAAYHTFTERKINFPSFLSSFPLLIFVLTLIGTLIANPEGRPEALQSKGLTLMLLPLTSYFLLSYHSQALLSLAKYFLTFLGTLLSLHSLLSLTFLSKSPYVPSYMQDITFTPTGSYLSTLIIIIFSSSLLLALLKHASKKLRLYLFTSLALHTIAITAIISLMLPGGSLLPSSLSFGASWSIALDALKSLRSLFFGIGLSNYSLLYVSVKPLSVNATTLWNSLPSTASSELLTLLPTAGVLVTASFIFMMFQLLLRSARTVFFFPALILILGFLFFPATSSLYLLFFILYGLTQQTSSPTYSLNRLASYIVSFLILGLAVFISWTTARSFLSERYISLGKAKLDAADSQGVYQYHIRAIQTSPKITNYHLSFADLNFKLAAALSQKQDLTDADRETITRLIRQSVESGKSAIALRPNDPRTWLTIAKIYQNLISVADNADTFALEAYTRAITLDRANPSLRLEYANLLTQIASSKNSATESANLLRRAASEIQAAIQLKPDFGNAYYNLGLLYKNAGELETAKKAFETTLQYLNPDTQEYAQVQNEIANLNAPPLVSPSPIPSTSP